MPLNVLLTADEIAYHLDDSDAVALVAAAALVTAGASRDDARGHVPAPDRHGPGTPPGRALSFDALLATGTPYTQTAATNADDTAVILYTSGTTGKPKGAELTHANLLLNAHLVKLQLVPLTPDTVALGILPLFHSFGQTVIQNAVLATGGSIVLMSRFDAAGAMALMQKHGVSFFAGVPTMYFALLNHPEASRYDLSALRHCVSGGASLPVEVLRSFDARYDVSILEGYGLSETSPVASFNLRERERKPGSVGLPVWGCEMRLVDESGQEITEPLVRGEIQIKGHNIMRGYWKKPEATATALQGRLVLERRHRPPRRGWLLLHRRPEEGHDHSRRLQRVPARNRGSALRPPGRRRSRGRRRCRTRATAKKSKPSSRNVPATRPRPRKTSSTTAGNASRRISTRASSSFAPRYRKARPARS